MFREDAIDTDEKAGAFEFFGRRCPLNVEAEEVAQDGFGEMEGESSKVEDEEGQGSKGFPCRPEEALLPKSKSNSAVCDRCL